MKKMIIKKTEAVKLTSTAALYGEPCDPFLA